LDTINLIGFPLLSGTLGEAADYISESSKVDVRPAKIICHINASNLERILQNPPLLRSLRARTSMFMDGIGVKVAAAYLGKGWKPDVNGTDLFPLVMDQIKDYGTDLFLLGGKPGVAELASQKIKDRWSVPIAGFRDGYFTEAEEQEVCEVINESGAQILLVGRGCPLQEEFVLRNQLNLKVRLIWAVGGLFDFLSGRCPRAPMIWRRARLEWMFRWLVQPLAKAHRTWIEYPRFVFRAVRERVNPLSRGPANPKGGVDPVASSLPIFPIISTKAPVKGPEAGFSPAVYVRTAATELLARHYGVPPYLIIFVSDQCWMRCSHCWFSEDWKETHHTRPLMSFDQYDRLGASYERLPSSAQLHFVSFTGGEAFRREDIVELVTMMRRKARIKRYAIPTSGYMSDMIVEKATQLLLRNPDTPFRLDVSLDGTAEIHDRIRRINGGWEKAVETIKRLNRLKDKYAHFDVGVITTVSRKNQEHVEEISRTIQSFHGGEWMINIARGQTRDPHAIDVDLTNYRRAGELADKSIGSISSGHRGNFMGPLLTAKNTVRRRIIVDTIEGRRSGGGCAAGSLGGVIYADGEVHACELLDDKLGNLHDFDYDLNAIWQGEAARKLRRHIQESRCQCTQECFLSVSMLIQPTALAGMAGELAKRSAKSALRIFQTSH
jgi:exopolysaccharide biosynthesis WecB/TagA/CpsF family protein